MRPDRNKCGRYGIFRNPTGLEFSDPQKPLRSCDRRKVDLTFSTGQTKVAARVLTFGYGTSFSFLSAKPLQAPSPTAGVMGRSTKPTSEKSSLFVKVTWRSPMIRPLWLPRFLRSALKKARTASDKLHSAVTDERRRE